MSKEVGSRTLTHAADNVFRKITSTHQAADEAGIDLKIYTVGSAGDWRREVIYCKGSILVSFHAPQPAAADGGRFKSRAAIGQGPAMHDPPTSAGVRDGFEIMVFNNHRPPADVGLHRQG